MITGTQLRSLRNFKGLKQDYVARKIGVSQSTYSDVENFTEPITGKKLESILAVLGLTLEKAVEILGFLPPVNNS